MVAAKYKLKQALWAWDAPIYCRIFLPGAVNSPKGSQPLNYGQQPSSRSASAAQDACLQIVGAVAQFTHPAPRPSRGSAIPVRQGACMAVEALQEGERVVGLASPAIEYAGPQPRAGSGPAAGRRSLLQTSAPSEAGATCLKIDSMTCAL